MISQSSRPLVLCLEDDPVALRLRTMLLQHAGYEVLPAQDLDAALKAVRENEVCLVISDHVLKSARGTEVAAHIKQIKPTLPILLLSGAVPDQLNNVDCFMLKTEPPQTILRMVSDLVHRACS